MFRVDIWKRPCFATVAFHSRKLFSTNIDPFLIPLDNKFHHFIKSLRVFMLWTFIDEHLFPFKTHCWHTQKVSGFLFVQFTVVIVISVEDEAVMKRAVETSIVKSLEGFFQNSSFFLIQRIIGNIHLAEVWLI